MAGREFGVGAVVVSNRDRLERHLRTLGILWVVLGALFLLPSLFFMGIGGVAHSVIPFEAGVAREFGPFVLFMLGGTLLILGAGGILVGWGLMKHQSWARIAAIVLGFSRFPPAFRNRPRHLHTLGAALRRCRHGIRPHRYGSVKCIKHGDGSHR